MSDERILYHTGFSAIPSPDIRYGRKNADFGQGFYLSGVLEPAESLRLLRIGPVYEQTVLKTEKAALHLRWIGAERIPDADLKRYREALAAEEAAYQTMLAKVMETAEG